MKLSNLNSINDLVVKIKRINEAIEETIKMAAVGKDVYISDAYDSVQLLGTDISQNVLNSVLNNLAVEKENCLDLLKQFGVNTEE